MTNHRTIQPDAWKVIVGVDTHKHVHVAVAIDTWGIRLGDRSCAAVWPRCRVPTSPERLP